MVKCNIVHTLLSNWYKMGIIKKSLLHRPGGDNI